MNVDIRKYEESDTEAHYNAVMSSLPEISKWFTWAKLDYCLCDSYDFVMNQSKRKNEGWYDYAIIDGDSGHLLGSCGLRRIETCNNKRIAAMSYWIRTDKSGQKITKKAAELLKIRGFNELDFDSIEIDIAHCNQGSIGVVKGIGAKRERDIQIKGGDGKYHKGAKYILKRNTT